MKRLVYPFLLICASGSYASAQSYSDFFDDATLRVDYTLAGSDTSQHVFFNELLSLPHWCGRRVNLSSAPVHGNGQVLVTDVRTGEVIYANGFSTLFQEWVHYDEASLFPRSFEGVALVPMPKSPARVTLRLFDSRREVAAEASRLVDPSDVLIRKVGLVDVPDYERILKADDDEACIRVAILAEGFTEPEMPHFMDKAREAVEAIFAHPPFDAARGKFDIVAVKAVSAQSGVSEPSRHKWLSTVAGAHFDSFYAERYLTTLRLRRVHDALAGVPYDHIIILANTPLYGGGGILNFYTMSSTDNEWFRPVIVHEFGHAFAGLADEYAYEGDTPPMYPQDVEPWEPNITTLVDIESKWKDMEGVGSSCGKVGTYEGAGYSLKGVYRPAPNCRMRDNRTRDFCPVCQRAIKLVIERLTRQM